MGKIKKKSNTVLSSNGTSEILVEKHISPADGLFQDTPISTIIEKLQDPHQREQAAVQLANLQLNAVYQQQIIQTGLFSHVAKASLDSTPSSGDSRLYLIGALKNFSDSRSQEICDAMVDQGVVTALCSLLDEYKQPWTPSQASIRVSTTFAKTTYDSKTRLLREALALLCNLCEVNSQAMEVFNQSTALPVLLAHLHEQFHPSQVAVDVARCLYSLSENNSLVDQILQQPPHSELLFRLASADNLPALLKASAAGTLLNACPNCPGEVTSAIAKVALGILDTNLGVSLQTFAQNFDSLKEKSEENGSQEATEQDEVRLEELSDELLDLISAKQIALEILANLGLQHDPSEEDQWMDEDSDDSASDSVEEHAASHVEDSQEEDSLVSMLGLPADRVLDTVLSHGHSLPPDVTAALEAYPPLLDNVQQLQVTALRCLPNLLHGVPQLPVSQQDFWFSLVNAALQEIRPDMQSALTAAIRAMFPALVKSPGLLERITTQDLEFLYRLVGQTSDEEVQINVVSTIGVLGHSFSEPWRSVTSPAIVKSAGEFLLQVAQNSTSLHLVAEALNSIIDVFSSDDTDDAARELCLVAVLEQLAKTFSKMTKKRQRNTLISTVKDNLPHFIRYKKQRIH